MKTAKEWLEILGEKPTLEQVVAIQQESYDGGFNALEESMSKFIDEFSASIPNDVKDYPDRPK